MDDACLITIIIAIIIIVIGFLLLIVIGRRPKFLCNIPNRDTISYRRDVLNRLNNQRYKVVEKENGNIFVQKDTFSATTLVFKQNGPNVEVAYIHSNSNLFLVIFIICFITIWIIAIILAVIADLNSKGFRNDELKPLLTGYSTGRICPNCGRPIPFDAMICPYCGKDFRQL
jgi:hypothetical protein